MWYIEMDNATYQGMVITIQVVVSVFDFLFFPSPKARMFSRTKAK